MPKFKEVEKISAELFDDVVIYTITEPGAMDAPRLMEFVKEMVNAFLYFTVINLLIKDIHFPIFQ